MEEAFAGGGGGARSLGQCLTVPGSVRVAAGVKDE